MWSYFFVALPTILSLVFAILLLFYKGCNRKLAYSMSACLFIGMLIYVILGAYYLQDYELTFSLDIVYGYALPLIFPAGTIYVNILTQNTISRVKLSVILLPPLIYGTIIWTLYYMIGHNIGIQLMQNVYYGMNIILPHNTILKYIDFIGFKFFNYFIAYQILYFLFDTYIALTTYNKCLQHYYSDSDSRKYRMHYVTIISFMCLSFTCLLYCIIIKYYPRSQYNYINYLFFIHSILIYLIGRSVLQTTHTMHDVISQNQRIEQLITNSETKLTDTEIFNKLTICLVQNKFILHPHLSIYDLCTELNVNRIRLTSIIQEHHNLSFAAYINKLRIDYACECLKRKPNTTIDNLFAQCGFNSIASFYRAFKTNKQCSPKQWLSTNCYQCEVNE